MIEMVTKITQAEEAAAQLKKDVQQKAAQMEADTHKAGKADNLRLKADCEAEAARIVEAARAEAERLGREQLELAGSESRALSDAASAKIGAAASFIVERIVATK